MHGRFNMAYHDNASALQVYIKVNNENLLPISQKHNAGSLRIPADPSWPKIPQRKIGNDVGDIIDSPYVVTLTGSPRRSRTVVRTPLNHSARSVNDGYTFVRRERTVSSMHTMKRLPGCADPRFKKVTNIRKTDVTSAVPSEQENETSKETSRSALTIPLERLRSEETDAPIPERDLNTKQVTTHEAEKPDETRNIESIDTPADRKTDDNFNTRKPTSEQEHRVNSSECKNPVKVSNDIGIENEITEHKERIRETCCYRRISGLMSSMKDANTQENNGQLFFVVDKKIQTHPINAINGDGIAIAQECANQCCNLQVPVLTYQNIPVQISKEGRGNEIKHCLNPSNVHDAQNENMSLTTNAAGILEQKNRKVVVADGEQNNTLQMQSIVTENDKENSCNSNNAFSTRNSTVCLNPNVPEKLENVRTQRRIQESSDSEYYLPNRIKKSVCANTPQRLKLNTIPCKTTGEDTTDSEFIVKKNILKGKSLNGGNKSFAKQIKKSAANASHNGIVSSINNYDEGENKVFQQIPQLRSNTSNSKKNKSEENLYSARNEFTKKLLRNSEPYITLKQKKVSAKLSKKTRSYFKKNSHSAMVDSDYSLIFPSCQYNKRKSSQQMVQKLCNYRAKRTGNCSTVKLSPRERDKTLRIENNLKFDEQNIPKHDRGIERCDIDANSLSGACVRKEQYKQNLSPGSNTEDMSEKPKCIPLKTQELLNKSYWEYYNRLRHKVKSAEDAQQQYLYQLTTGAPDMKTRKADEMYQKDLKNQLKSNPELQTLQQCSALSTMINKTLDPTLQSPDTVLTKELYLNRNMKSSSDPTAGTQSAIAKQINPALEDKDDDELAAPIIVNKAKRKREKRADKQFLELKTIIFFGSMMYLLIILLPMLYDYFYHEEYDHYENLSYIELTMEYILSSFNEAFGGFFNGVKKIFFHTRSCKKCNSIV